MKKFLLSSVAVLLSVSIMAQSSASLRMNPEKNKVYRFKSSSDQTILQTVNGNQQTIESKVDYTLSLKMIDATPDFLITEIRFDTMFTKTNTMGKTTIISSASEGNIKSAEMGDILSCIMNRLSKNALYVKMDYSGKPLEIVNSKMLSDAVMKDTASITLTGMMATAVKSQITNMVSEKALKTMIEMFTYRLPGKQVNKGESWDVTVKTTSGGMMLDVLTSYHLDGIEGNTANLTAESGIKASENADPMESGGAKITYDDLKGMSKSTMMINTNTGLVIEEKAKTHIAGNLGVSVQGMNMVIPMDINGESKVVALQ